MEILNTVRALGSVGTNQVVAVLAEGGHHGCQQAAWFEREDLAAGTAVCVEVPKTSWEIFEIRGDTSLKSGSVESFRRTHRTSGWITSLI